MKMHTRTLVLLVCLLGLASPAFAQYPAASLGGTWYFHGKTAQIWQQGNTLTFQNENGTYSRGAVVGPSTVVAYDWGNLYAQVTPSGQEIVWPDGATWTRFQTGGGQPLHFALGVCATWPGCSVYASGNGLVFVNERGEPSNGYAVGQNRVYATGWKLGGTLIYSNAYLARIEWDNGTWWGR